MSRGPRIKDWVKWYIREQALRNRAEPRDLVAERIEEYLADKEPVSHDTLLKMISSARNSNDPEDKPWSVSAIADSDIAPSALPIVMNAWAKGVIEDAPISIRQAKWVARLSSIYDGKTHTSLEWLIVKASEYANREKAIKAVGTYPARPQDMHWLWFCDALLYLDARDKDIDVAKRLMAKFGILYENKGGTK